MQLSRDLGPIFWLDMMGKPMVIVSGYDLVDELCDEQRFDKSTRGALRKLRPVAHGLFTADTAGAALVQVAQHPAADLRAARHAGLPRSDARYRRSADAEVGTTQLRRRDRRHRRHDAPHARHHRPVRLRLSLQFVLSRRQPSLRRRHGALALDHHAARGLPLEDLDQSARAAPAARRHPLHARRGRERDQGPAQQRARTRARRTC